MPSPVYTTSSLLLHSLSEAGITHAFVNWGSDHPALLEDLERQRFEVSQAAGSNDEEGRTKPRIVICPNEMVALSSAQGFAQATGKPAAVIIHVDVGTQALAGAVHNADRSRTPVLIYAGASPFSAEREYKGTRNEWIMWLQDIPDQAAIVRQYMRHTSQLGSAKTIDKSVKRALQIGESDPKGPVYLWARREVMEEEVDEASFNSISGMQSWPSLEPSGLSPFALSEIIDALLTASSPLIFTSHIGRNPRSVAHLHEFASLLSIPIMNVCPSSVNVPFSHPSYAGVTFLGPGTHYARLGEADVILVLECDPVPWIPANDAPRKDARVFILDSGDPLKIGTGYWHVDAEMLCRADSGVSLKQIVDSLKEMGVLEAGWSYVKSRVAEGELDVARKIQERKKWLLADHAAHVSKLDALEEAYPPSSPSHTSSFTLPNLLSVLRRSITSLTPSSGADTLILNESISNYNATWMHLRPEHPGSVLQSGGSSLGWSLGAAVGASLGATTFGTLASGNTNKGHDLIVVIVGDGSFMFGVPSSAYWMARKYGTPFLTIVLNNGGWKSPKLSMSAIYPNGHGISATGAQLSVGFGPDCPDYSQIAVAASAGWAWGARIGGPGWAEGRVKEELTEVIQKAIKVVLEEKRCAVVDCILDSI